ncbi:MAG TPA: response regulator [Rhizomicrobium sp.]|nr:response regulator [Rhizomicrobium sp.]
MSTDQPRIVILDDDPSVRTAIGRLLKTSQMEVETCSTGPELLSRLMNHPADCLLLDLQMPGMNGLDVMEYLGRLELVLPVIVITAHDEPGSRDACLAAGAVAYLRKPLDADELVAAIRSATETPELGPRSN